MARSLLKVQRPAAIPRGAEGVDADLYRRRVVRVFAVLTVYGLVALAVDLFQTVALDAPSHVMWPRLAALAVVAPLTLLAARGAVGPALLRASELLVYLVIVGDVATELLVSRWPIFAAEQPVMVILFLRACFVPTSAREQAVTGGVVVAALTTAAYAYMRVLGHDLTPEFTGAASGNVALQIASVAISGAVFVGITTYAAAEVNALRLRAAGADRLGQYELEELIGEGGMGQVFRARHGMLERATAIKVVRGEGKVGAELQARFEREVRAAAQLRHASAVAIYDFGVSARGRLYYAMELLNGLTLAALVEMDGPMPAERAAHLLVHVLGALEEAHASGLVHRDVKPENVMVTRNGAEHDFPKLLDYGLVHLKRGADPSLTLTRRGTITGTPLYMAPELVTGDAEPDGRTDLYSLGAVGYFLITGAAPFTGDNATKVLLDQVRKRPTPPSERSELPVPKDFEDVILRALEKRPDDRFASAREMRVALRACACFGAWTEERAADWWRLHAPNT